MFAFSTDQRNNCLEPPGVSAKKIEKFCIFFLTWFIDVLYSMTPCSFVGQVYQSLRFSFWGQAN